ncbi:hypothetical protein GCM10011504_24990 [Siccirubricoccus deserti]|uniref:Ribbon-helix-helix protein, CopG family n=1 Tax=Siccirubricoccus deserti TaxID=2013562 RepID=A0A9X0QXW4_9PROT|nr:hypothetical protein [Siccirubricoccus deserti]MBC4015905.1 hypothetical protein [Siccirubricoccus deserti]GGC45513.1 hypothetical protein GCM10011504_24990 [Siccirubricoccus deserti]
MQDPFFAKLAASGWRVPFRQRIAHRFVCEEVVPPGIRIKIRANGRDCAEWQLRVPPIVFGRRRARLPIDTPYAQARTLDAALAAASAEAARLVEQFRAAPVQASRASSKQVAAAHVQPAEEEVDEEDQGPIPDPRQGDLAIGKRRNGYRRGKRTATVVLDVEMHERLAALARSSGRTIQALLVEGAEMVLARLQEGHPRKVG